MQVSGGRQHGTPVVPRAAAAQVVAPVLIGDRVIELQPVIEAQFVTRVDQAPCVKVHAQRAVAVQFFDGFTVRCAAMIDPARGIAVLTTINAVTTVAEREQERVKRFVRVDCLNAPRGRVGDTPASVFNDAGAARNIGKGEHTVAVGGASPDLDSTGHDVTCQGIGDGARV